MPASIKIVKKCTLTQKATPILEAQAIGFSFEHNSPALFSGLDIQIYPGTKTALTGQSGSGKTTLLHILSGLQKPSSGTVIINDVNILTAQDQQLAKLRNKTMGFIYQEHCLLKDFTAIENIALPLLIAGKSAKQAQEQAYSCLCELQLSHLADMHPKQLSGGEKQRIAIARALITKPKIIIADEPTGNLDRKSTEIIIESLTELCSHKNMALFIATHNLQIASNFDTHIQLL